MTQENIEKGKNTQKMSVSWQYWPSYTNVSTITWRNRPLSRYSCSAKVWSNTRIKHTTGKNKPSLVSAPIFRVTNQSTVKCHHFENCNFYKVLYGERARLIYHACDSEKRQFPSFLSPLFQSESKCEAFHMEISFIHMQIEVHCVTWRLLAGQWCVVVVVVVVVVVAAAAATALILLFPHL